MRIFCLPEPPCELVGLPSALKTGLARGERELRGGFLGERELTGDLPKEREVSGGFGEEELSGTFLSEREVSGANPGCWRAETRRKLGSFIAVCQRLGVSAGETFDGLDSSGGSVVRKLT
jgi:hypothetical protein